jgi:hypothetical protein
VEMRRGMSDHEMHNAQFRMQCTAFNGRAAMCA